MSEIQKIMIAVFGAILSGFILVGVSKQDPSDAQKEAGAKIRNFANMQTMANHKCPLAVKEHTGEQVYVIAETESDKETYLTMKWDGENVKTGGFKKASCTISAALGGISELVIDGKVIINKKI